MRPHSDQYQLTRGDRMKRHEKAWRFLLPSQSYVIIRVDGKAFHGLTKVCERPFDADFVESMDHAAVALCQEIQGAVFAYTQSDEISVLITDFNANQEQWFGGVVQKMCSVSAATASVAFNAKFAETFNRSGVFDSRVFALPNRDEVINYFLWRQADCFINSVSMVAQQHFSPKQLEYKTTTNREEMLRDVDVTMDQFPDGVRYGRVVTRVEFPATVEYTHRKTGEQMSADVLRHRWKVSTAPWFDWDEAGFLQHSIPDRTGGDE